MAQKRALIIQGGTMRGAFFVGALKSIYHLLGPEYFDTIFSTSVGIFGQAFFASGQIDVMENTWREYVHGRQLINYANPIRGRPILDLDYLTDLFQSDKSLLDIDCLNRSGINCFVFVADYQTRQPAVINFKDHDIFNLMKAACALPMLYPKTVTIHGKRYVDGCMASAVDFRNLLHKMLEPFDQVIAIVSNAHDSRVDIEKVIRPSRTPLLHRLDTDRARIIRTIEQGRVDTENFIKANRMTAGS